MTTSETNPCYWLDWCYPFYTLPTPAPPAPAIPTACPGGAGGVCFHFATILLQFKAYYKPHLQFPLLFSIIVIIDNSEIYSIKEKA